MPTRERYLVRRLTLTDQEGKNRILPLVILELTRLASTPSDGIEIEGVSVTDMDIREFERETEKTIFISSMVIISKI